VWAAEMGRIARPNHVLFGHACVREDLNEIKLACASHFSGLFGFSRMHLENCASSGAHAMSAPVHQQNKKKMLKKSLSIRAFVGTHVPWPMVRFPETFLPYSWTSFMLGLELDFCSVVSSCCCKTARFISLKVSRGTVFMAS
jgi:hypothetical protein